MVGNFIYYTGAVEPTIMVALSTLAAAQSKIIEGTKESVDHLLDYYDTNPNAKLRFHSGQITLRYTAMHNTYQNYMLEVRMHDIFPRE